MPTCLLFDLFGTLIEYKPDGAHRQFPDTHDLVKERAGLSDYAEFISLVETIFGDREKLANESGIEFHMDDLAADISKALEIGVDADFEKRFVTSYMVEWMAGLKPVPGASGLLHRLARHYRMGLISNTHYPPMVYQLLEQMDLAKIFEVVTLSAEFGTPKPHVEIFTSTLETLDLHPSDAVYIGDSYDHDYRGARNAGITAYLIGSHARVPRDYQLRSILDLPIHFNTDR